MPDFYFLDPYHSEARLDLLLVFLNQPPTIADCVRYFDTIHEPIPIFQNQLYKKMQPPLPSQIPLNYSQDTDSEPARVLLFSFLQAFLQVFFSAPQCEAPLPVSVPVLACQALAF